LKLTGTGEVYRTGAIRLSAFHEVESEMDLFESETHSFIIKIWLEDDGRTRWRGHITHVPDGERRYLEDLGEISRFIRPYLEKMGVEIEKRPVRSWLARWKKPLRKRD